MSGRNEKSAPRFGATAGRVPVPWHGYGSCRGRLAIAVALAAMVLVSAAGKEIWSAP